MRSRLSWRLRFLLGRCKRQRQSGLRGRVICFILGGLGDKLMALPAVRYFRKEFANSELTLVVVGLCPPFFRKEADRLIVIKASSLWLKVVPALRGFDACFINSLGLFDIWADVAAFLSGAADLRGPISSGQMVKDTVYTKPYVFGTGHETAVNFRGAGGVCDEAALPYTLCLPESVTSGEDDDLVVMHPGSSSVYGLVNRWSLSNFAELGGSLVRLGFRVLAVGTEAERELLERLREESRGTVAVRMNLPLAELAGLLHRSRVVIANDSGIGHLAAAVGANLITVMGATCPEKIAPVGASVTVIGPRCPHGGCYGRLSPEECLNCVNLIRPEEVLECVLQKGKSGIHA